MTALSTASSGGMVGEYDMSSRGHSYDFATATLSAEDVNVRNVSTLFRLLFQIVCVAAVRPILTINQINYRPAIFLKQVFP